MASKTKKLTKEQKALRRKLFRVLKQQGFKINPHIRPAIDSKEYYRKIQSMARLEQLSLHQTFLKEFLPEAMKYCRDGKEIVPENITLELRLVKPDSFEDKLFRWWNFIWWSIPYQRPYGRMMRFILWDTTHNAPLGLILLQSPVLQMSVRDNALRIPRDKLDIWINKSLNAQRTGALPPYNDLLGGKMVALAMTSNEVRESYRKKYSGTVTLLEKRVIEPDLLFVTTTSAFGKSSMYDRLNYNGKTVAQSLGYTQGAGSFHIPETLYEEIIVFLKRQGINAARGYGNGPSRKIKLINEAFSRLRLPRFSYHGIKREFYIFPLVSNLGGVIHNDQSPLWYDRPFSELVEYWKNRWAIPRSKSLPRWKEFTSAEFLNNVKQLLDATGSKRSLHS